MAAVRTDELHSPAASGAAVGPISCRPPRATLGLIDAPSSAPGGFVAQAPEEAPEFRSFREAHPLRWGLDRVTSAIAARLWEAPMFVAVDPGDRPLAGELADPVAVCALESAVPERYRLLVPLMRWGGLSWSELAGLRRRFCTPGRIRIVADGDLGRDRYLQHRSLRYRATYTLDSGLAEDLGDHLDRFVTEFRHCFVFRHDDGARLELGRFVEEVWTPALEQAGLSIELDPVDLTVCWQRENAP